jgi:ketol-acid reductoisomerase
MESTIFDLIDIDLADTSEQVLAGGRHLFSLLPSAFAGIEQIGIIGWGPQARAQAMNLRDSLRGTSIRVSVGLRSGSSSFDGARADGFSETDGTLGDMLDIVRTSDLVILLISDAPLDASLAYK